MFPPKLTSDWINFFAIELFVSYVLWNTTKLFWFFNIAWCGVMLGTSLAAFINEDNERIRLQILADYKEKATKKPSELEALYALSAGTILDLAQRADKNKDDKSLVQFLNAVESRLDAAWREYAKENRKRFAYYEGDTASKDAAGTFKGLQDEFNKTKALEVLDDILYEYLNAQRVK